MKFLLNPPTSPCFKKTAKTCHVLVPKYWKLNSKVEFILRPFILLGQNSLIANCCVVKNKRLKWLKLRQLESFFVFSDPTLPFRALSRGICVRCKLGSHSFLYGYRHLQPKATLTITYTDKQGKIRRLSLKSVEDKIRSYARQSFN